MHVIYIKDDGVPYAAAVWFFAHLHLWATKQCSSYVGYRIQDVSDSSLTNDFIAAYTFSDSADSLLFSLKWNT
jgi:hypothetical protein